MNGKLWRSSKVEYNNTDGGERMANELYHYGRLGMKWGQRRFTNRYGGLNRAGRMRIKQLESEHDELSNIGHLSKKGVKRKEDVEREYSHLTGKSINDRIRIATQKPKSMREMTNEELTAYNTRKQLEETYQKYQPKHEVSKGRQFAAAVGKKFILPIAVDVGKAYLTSVLSDKATKKDMTKAAGKAAEEARKAAEKATEKAMKSLMKG